MINKLNPINKLFNRQFQQTTKHSPINFKISRLCIFLFLSSQIMQCAFARTPNQPGDPLPGLTNDQLAYFNDGLTRFNEVDGVADGLGPRFNLNSCVGCHAFPATGGTSPPTNPQIAVATLMGAKNNIPSFISPKGPIREARFIKNPDGTPDGGVHDLFVITGRSDAPALCNIKQPDFSNKDNIIFRIPTPIFGAGLIEAIKDSTILENMNDDQDKKKQLGISGHPNRSGNDGTITRFGWKAQNKSLLIFAGEAYNVEMGVSNTLFPQEREDNPQCAINPTPEDDIRFAATLPISAMSDAIQFTTFMRFLAPLPPKPLTVTAQKGQQTFNDIGCGMCHTPTMKSGKSNVDALSLKDVNLFSDLLVHHMGAGLADNVTQGAAGPDEFRTAPLWGLSQRLFFLHDGRTSDLTTTIKAHASATTSQFPASEANAVINNFNRLSPQDRANLLEFLQSL